MRLKSRQLVPLMCTMTVPQADSTAACPCNAHCHYTSSMSCIQGIFFYLCCLITVLATYTACVINGGLQARDVNKQQLLAELTAVKPARPLAGIQTFQLIYMPTINLASYVDVSARLGRCAVAIAQTLIAPVPAVVEVPFACQSLVDY